MSVIDVEKGRVVETVPLGAYPRGIAVDSSSRTAYVAVMGSTDIAKVDLRSFAVDWIYGVGSGPRHLNISPNDRFLYVTLNGSDYVAKINVERGVVVNSVSTGDAPRSMAIADDGQVALRRQLLLEHGQQGARPGPEGAPDRADDASPIGVTYDAESSTVWVACYSGSIMVFENR